MKRYEAYKDSGVGWVDLIPVHWTVKSLKMAGESKNSKRVPLSSEERGEMTNKKYDYYGASGVIDKVNDYIFDEKLLLIGEDGANLLTRSKRLVFSVSGKYWVNNHAHILKPYPSEDIDYLEELLESLDYSIHVSGSAQPKLTSEELMSIKIISPPISEQTQIAHYLDYKTAQIDALVEKKERLIALLEEERTALINEVVTGKKVWNGSEWTAPTETKASGIEWLGEIPKEWELSRVGYVSNVVRGASPRPAGDPSLFNGDYLPWITVKEVTNAKGKFIQSTETFLTELGAQQTRILEPETLVLSNSGATLGVPRIILIKGAINDGSVAFLDLNIEREFLYYFFVSHTQIYREESAGSGQPNLNTQIVKATQIPLPPLTEQKRIVEIIESEIEKLDSIVNKVSSQISLLKEYKTALISEVVTGKIDVRDEVVPHQKVAESVL